MELTVEEIRRRNLGLLIQEFKTQLNIAWSCKVSVAYLSHIHTQAKKKNGKIATMGSELARKLEKGLGKPTGWMDISHDNELEIVNLYNEMTDEMRDALLNQARLMIKLRKE